MAYEHLIDGMSGRQFGDAPERTLSGSSCGKVTRPTPSPVTRAEVEAAVQNVAQLAHLDGKGGVESKETHAALDTARALLTRLLAERDEAVAALKIASDCMNDMHGLLTAPDGEVTVYIHAAFGAVAETLAKIGAVTP